MEFRRSGQRDDRRRRVLREENPVSPDETDGGTPARPRRSGSGVSSTGRSYSDDALRERQPRVVDLLPTRPFTLSVFVLLALVVVAALAAAHIHLSDLARLAGRENLTSLDLAGPNSLGAWFSSLLFTVAAGGSLLIYSLRRHKVDDYRGRYRVWLPAAAALLLLSLDATAGLNRFAAGALARVSYVQGFGNGALWSVALFGLLFATLGVRLAIEMRRSRAASVAFLCAAACYGLSVPLWLNFWLARDPALAALARSVVTLLGHVAVSTSVGLYARYVFLDAQGLLAARRVRAKRPKKIKAKAADESSSEESGAATPSGGKTRRIDPAHTEAAAPKSAQPATTSSPGGTGRAAGPLASKMGASATSGAKFGDPAQAKAAATISRQALSDDDDEDDDEDDGDDDNSRLSKAERRRLKKLQRRGKF